MYIVGTSGHIDHGKTSLIKALTGVDCDRLPEEKSREMTIDIGFSKIDYPKLGTVSIIDVPGHERFIRNMVVGAWGIDLGLLVIAVDDSWMPQTEDHFRVLDLLGIERIVVALTKIDMADQEMIEFAEEEAKDRIQNSRFKECDIVRVSSKTGEGLEELKTVIKKNLEKLSKAADSGKPYLFIDRVFESRGHGTIITGTLKNGLFNENDDVDILPGKSARIKKIESHYHSENEGSPSQRTALNLSGVSINDLKRGDIIVHRNFFTESKDIIASINLLDKNKKVKNNLGIEILIGTKSIKAKFILLNEINNQETFPVRLKIDELWFFYPGEPFIITNPGGYRIIGGGRVLIPDNDQLKDRKILKEIPDHFKDFSKKEIIEFIIKTKKAIHVDNIRNGLPYKNKLIDKYISELLEEKTIVQIDDFIAETSFYEKAKKKIAGTISTNTGLNIKEISDSAEIDLNIAKLLIVEILNENSIVEKDGKYFTGDSISEDSLPENKKKALENLFKRGIEGLELDKIRDDSLKKNIKEMIRLGFAISLDGSIIYHYKIYDELKSKILDLFNSLERITIADVREVTSLSRKYLIPLLNRIENDGLIKRLGDFRIKV
ncbi:MAG: selenocysteine-specific translation elongation factor [Spirochaetes bacterium]|nr:selenocysteine-specific translation elongation factor [Spirochaetota bacterium]